MTAYSCRAGLEAHVCRSNLASTLALPCANLHSRRPAGPIPLIAQGLPASKPQSLRSIAACQLGLLGLACGAAQRTRRLRDKRLTGS